MSKPGHLALRRLRTHYHQADEKVRGYHAYGPLDDRLFLESFLMLFCSFSKKPDALAFDLFELKSCLLYLRRGVEVEGIASPLALRLLQDVSSLETALLDFLSRLQEAYLAKFTEILAFYGTYSTGQRFVQDASVTRLYLALLSYPSEESYRKLHEATLAFLAPACQDDSWLMKSQPREFRQLLELREELEVQYLLMHHDAGGKA